MNVDKIHPSFLEKIKLKPIISKEIEERIGKSTLDQLILSRESKIKTIISFKNDSDRKKFIKNHKNLEIISTFEIIPSLLMEIDQKTIFDLSEDGLIKCIEENQRLYQSMNNVSELLNIKRFKNSLLPFTGKNVSIALLDSGIGKNFESLDYSSIHQINFTNEEPSDENFHATLLTHILKNKSSEFGEGYIGLCPDVKIIDFKIFNNAGVAYFSDFLKAFDHILENDFKFNILLICSCTLNPVSNGNDILSKSCDILFNKLNIIIVTSGGNFGPEFNTIGSSGTSISATFCAGIIALIKETKPQITRDEILELFNKSKTFMAKRKSENVVGFIDVVQIFKILGLYEEKPVPYSTLVKKAIYLSIGFLIICLILFYSIRFLDFILI
ncbi:hypothetical protein ES703_89921 [subsurface metagenome]